MNGYAVEYWSDGTVKGYVAVMSQDDVPEGWGWALEGEELPVPVPAPLTEAQIESGKRSELQELSQLAANQKSALTNRIGVINDAVEFEEATPSELSELPTRIAQLEAWKRYAVLLGRVTTHTGWYQNVKWPKQPEEGMDLETSPVGRT